MKGCRPRENINSPVVRTGSIDEHAWVRGSAFHANSTNEVVEVCKIPVETGLRYSVRSFDYLEHSALRQVHLLWRSDLEPSLKLRSGLDVCLCHAACKGGPMRERGFYGREEALRETLTGRCTGGQ